MQLENMSYPEVEQYLEHNNSILLPIGSVEQHGPYGILGTDFIAAEGIAREVGEKLGILVAPAVSYGVSPHHMNFKGTATLSPTTLIQLLVDICGSYVAHGFRRLFVINGHGGNKSSIETAFQELKMRKIPGQFALIAWYEGLKETQLVQELFHNQEGSHATPSEISLTMVFRPEAFRQRKIDEKTVVDQEYYWPLTSDEMEKNFPDGRMGAASWLASPDKGRLIKGLAVETLTERIQALQKIPLIELD